jgi:hypothetical protein
MTALNHKTDVDLVGVKNRKVPVYSVVNKENRPLIKGKPGGWPRACDQLLQTAG